MTRTPLTPEERTEAEVRLTGARALTRVLRKAAVGDLTEVLARWTTVTNVGIKEVAGLDGDVSWTARTFYDKRHPRPGALAQMYGVCVTLTELAPHLRWRTDEDLADLGTATITDRDVWAEVVFRATDAVASVKQYEEARQQVDRLRRDLAANDVRYLHGYYVRVKNSRRVVYGWVDKGRGKSAITVTVDPLDGEGLRGGLNETTAATYARLTVRALNQGDWVLSAEAKVSWSDRTRVEVLLPPTDAACYRAEVRRLIQSAQDVRDDARTMTEAVKAWRADHAAVIERQANIKRVVDKFADFDPLSVEHIVNTVLKDWIAEAKRLHPTSITDILRARALDQVGGPLTPAEQDTLDTQPEGFSNHFDNTWRHLTEKQVAAWLPHAWVL